MKHELVDLLIVGAGPAGMSAALEARRHGLMVLVLDEQSTPGGQIYRNVRTTDAKRLEVLGSDYLAGLALTDAFINCGARYVSSASVWWVAEDKQVHYLVNGQAYIAQSRRLLIATGAYERPMPIPGWTLPGVMTAGSGQILLKSAGLLPSGPVVLAGCGPLLYLLAVQYLRAGIELTALVDTSSYLDVFRVWKSVPRALRGWRELLKGVSLLATLRRAGIKHYRGARDLRIEGTDRARAVSFRHRETQHRIASDLILLHQGVVPNTQISWALRLEHRWNPTQLCWNTDRDSWGETSQPGIFIAGDGGSIGGAVAARLQGRIAALRVAGQLQKLDACAVEHSAAPLKRALTQQMAARPLIDALYRPLEETRIPADEVIVCRCEEVSAGDVRRYVDLGCLGPNQTKAFGRCGMGPCQGRLCGLSVTEVIADWRHVPPTQVGYYHIRPPIKPITLGQLAGESRPHVPQESA
ncbi:FAD/NAD(P)-binding oxidoreductase [Pseudomonas kielensis]|uniref:FAD/NAD(P)-dependent oxidoreductase n=1 Tax=Pseudomonas TaxID=286 RepID=UPI0014128E29|nr:MULTISPECIES: FAD/NAD(P)-binding oxidoreductase [Pseudomonas]NBB32515.1 FAD-dependent oxidoreductase [Pseudomonas sp. BC115LW]WKL55597.1 FAD/NAD(P)-binding oxidoreductase [Pseudomonas kielensis]